MADKTRKTYVLTQSGYKAIIDKDQGSWPMVWSASCPSGSWTEWRIPQGTKSLAISCSAALSIQTNRERDFTFSLPANSILSFNGLYAPGGYDYASLFFRPASTATVSVMYWVDTSMMVAEELSSSRSSTSSSSSSRSSMSSSSSA